MNPPRNNLYSTLYKFDEAVVLLHDLARALQNECAQFKYQSNDLPPLDVELRALADRLSEISKQLRLDFIHATSLAS